MIQAIDHIGIAVADINEGKQLYSKIFGVAEFHEEVVEHYGVHVASFLLNGVRIELTAPMRDDSPIAKFIERRGEGIHHMAFRSSDIHADLHHIEQQNIQTINKEPRDGAHDMLIAFLDPRSTGGVLMELCSPKPNKL